MVGNGNDPQAYTPRSSAFSQYLAILGDVRRRALARNGVWTEDWGAEETILALRGHCRGVTDIDTYHICDQHQNICPCLIMHYNLRLGHSYFLTNFLERQSTFLKSTQI